MKKSFHDQLNKEKIYFAFGRHWIFVLLRIFFFIIVLSLLLISPFFFAKWIGITPGTQFIFQMFLLCNFVITSFFVHRFFLWLFSYFSTYAIVTNFRIIVIKKSTFLKSEKEILDLAQIRDIQMRKRGLFCNLFNCGDINLILSTQENDATVIRHIYDPTTIQSLCNRVRHEHIQNYSHMLQTL